MNSTTIEMRKKKRGKAMADIQERDKLIKEWIAETAEKIEAAKSERLNVEEKSARNDLVTNMDKQIEKELTEKIRIQFPNDRICGEEGFGDELEDLDGTVWFIDPIDGTLNFVLQQENFAVMIGVYENGIGQQGYIYDVTQKRLYHAVKGQGVYCNEEPVEKPENKSLTEGLLATNSQLMTKDQFSEYRKLADQSMGVRMLGSAGLEVIELAKGNVVGYIASKLSPWDIAPGKVILEEFGFKIRQFDGTEVNLLNRNKAIFATPRAYDEIMTNIS